ncbi:MULTISPECIES: DUF563 domain-containing protein [unclassified Marinobacterium]|uniref:glycosyltransferase family 61 protein n=1 Tax=unclassified Marinobacterium TaxID=2644139 RepID=UPI001569C797|nr:MULTISPECIES: glycosyltransferase family 61 protein [unclassified Marinobacterium]
MDYIVIFQFFFRKLKKSINSTAKIFNESYKIKYIENKKVRQVLVECNDEIVTHELGESYYFYSNVLMKYIFFFSDGYHTPYSSLKFYFKKPIFSVRKVNYPIVYASNSVPGHYGHFIVYVAPVILFQLSKIKSYGKVYIYIGEIEPKQFHEIFFNSLNIDYEFIRGPVTSSKIIYFQRFKSGSVDNDFVQVNSREITRSFINFCKNHLSDRSFFPDKIFITRGNVKWRKLINEDEVKSLLIKHGYTCFEMDGLTINQQISLFGNAKKIIGVHGGAMSNIIFSKSSKILELFPYGYSKEKTTLLYSTISDNTYERLHGEEYDLSTEECYRNILVSLDSLESILESF